MVAGSARIVDGGVQYIADRAGDNGLISGSGFYMEMPPRFGWDGITQCYVVHAWRALSRLCGSAEDGNGQRKWEQLANRLRDRFVDMFWRDDHFAEYVHQERGLVDAHGLSDVNWAAVAFGLADHDQIARLWPRLMNEDGFWIGKMPTQIVTRPFSYETWELHEPLPFPTMSPLNDIAAMGRVWYLEALACQRQLEQERLLTSLRYVCRAASAEGYWANAITRNRTVRWYRPVPKNTVSIRRYWYASRMRAEHGLVTTPESQRVGFRCFTLERGARAHSQRLNRLPADGRPGSGSGVAHECSFGRGYQSLERSNGFGSRHTARRTQPQRHDFLRSQIEFISGTARQFHAILAPHIGSHGCRVGQMHLNAALAAQPQALHQSHFDFIIHAAY